MVKKGVSSFSVGNCLSKIAGKYRGRKLLCFRNVLVSQIFWIIGVSQFCRTFLSHSTEKFRGGTPEFRKYSGTEKFLNNKLSQFC